MRRMAPVVLALALALALVAAVLWLRRGATPRAPEAGRAVPTATGRAVAPRGEGLESAWLAGAKVRRVAGRVLLDGKPHAEAVVRLTTGQANAGDVTLALRRSGAGGEFTFAAVPAGRFHVRAEWPGREAADVVVDLRVAD